MKKQKVIAVALAAAITVMGAGYAGWTETVTINNTVETGKLSVALANGTVSVTDGTSDVSDSLSRTAEAIAVVTGDANVANVEVTNLYPGAVVTVTIPVTNDGTIPVLVETAMTASTHAGWFNVSTISEPARLGVEDADKSGEIIYTITVNDSAPTSITEASFTVVGSYKQFNQ